MDNLIQLVFLEVQVEQYNIVRIIKHGVQQNQQGQMLEQQQYM